MGGVPTKKRTQGKVRRGRSHHALKKLNLSPCSNCGAPVFGHRICPQCGKYGQTPGAENSKS
jgi:ribosomal protein L32